MLVRAGEDVRVVLADLLLVGRYPEVPSGRIADDCLLGHGRLVILGLVHGSGLLMIADGAEVDGVCMMHSPTVILNQRLVRVRIVKRRLHTVAGSEESVDVLVCSLFGVVRVEVP
jgi:hypothetical protein